MNDTNTASLLPSDSENGEHRCRPFVKWAGGKRQLLPELVKRLPTSYGRYFEPFVGGGALFFYLTPSNAVLADSNVELMNAYTVVRDYVNELIESLRDHRYEEQYYYEVRKWDRSESFNDRSPVERAARLLFLNKSCFNGLYRVNSSGHFNVPFGDYRNPTILDEENLRGCSQALQGIELVCEQFLDIEKRVTAGDFVYFDPPYAPISATADFTSYTRDGFTHEHQVALSELCKRLHRAGVMFMVSNSAAPVIGDLYSEFTTHSVLANRAINSKVEGRGKVGEVIVTNY